MNLTDRERSVLAGLQSIGGRHTYERKQTDAELFDKQLVPLLLALEAKGLIRIDEEASQVIGPRGESQWYVAIAADLTPAGQDALR